MADNDTQEKQIGWRRRHSFRVDMLLLAFLLVGWSLIFTTATLGLQPWNEQPWLDVSLIPQVAADYGPRIGNAPKLARIEPEIIDAVRQDQILRSTPTPSAVALAATPTFTTEPTVTPTFAPSELEISAGGPYRGEEGSQIALLAENISSILGLLPGLITYRWDLDNDGQYDDATGASASVLFNDEGDYTVSVRATDLLGRVGFDTTAVLVSNVPPFVNIGEDFDAKEGEDVAFSAFASDPGQDILLYSWDFNDGSPAVRGTLNPRHTFVNDGRYTVRLRVTDNDDGVSEDFLIVNVLNSSPLVDAGPDQAVNEGSLIRFEGTATDPGILDKLTYAWDFDYDGRTFTPDVRDRIGSTVYPNGPATIVAAMRVQDEDGGQTIDTIKVTVNNVPPVITSVSNTGPGGEGSPLSLTVRATDVGKDPLTYAFDWRNSGSFDVTGQPGTVSNIWYNQGSYTVRIRVDDGDGGQAFTTTTVSVFNQPPIAIASADPARLEGSPVRFDGSDSFDPGINDVLTHTWSFGDGSTARGVNVTHTYADNKVYSTTLTVSDDSGASSVASVPVTILNANPTANAGPDLTIDECVKNGNNYQCNNIPLALTGTATDPGTADILTLDWDCDLRNGQFEVNVTGASVTCVYPRLDGLRNPSDSSFIIALRVRDDDYNLNPTGGNEVGEAIDTLRVTVNNIPPWNVNAGGPYTGVESQPVLLTATAEDVPGDLAGPEEHFAWDLDSNPDFETPGNRVSHRWNRAGVYTVRLRVRDKDGGESFGSARVEIGNAPPIAIANATPSTTTVNIPVIFDATGSNDPSNPPGILTYRWNFDDGSPIVVTSSITVTHIYTNDRVYTATLQVDDNQGGIGTDTVVVVVSNLPPNAVADASPNPVSKGSQVTFDGSGSSDPDDNPATLTYQWDFGDGNNDTGVNVNHSYNNRGIYTATLTVTDDNGAADTDSLVITVDNLLPTADAGPDQTGFEGAQLVFDGSGSSDPNPGDTLTYQWDFGDGSPVASGVNPTHTYLDGPVTYTVTLSVTDSDGGTDTATTQVTVNNVPPTANAGPDQTVSEGSQVAFDGSGSSDPGADTLTYQWDFGDGSPVTNGISATHTYPIGPATYIVTLTVTDSDGDADTDTAQITVENGAPTANAGPDQTVAEGNTVTLDGSGSSDPGGGPITYAWDLDGDGQFNDATTVTANFSQGEPGTYSVALLVTDAQGLTHTDTAQVTVTNLPPTAVAGPDQTVNSGDIVTFDGSGSSDPGGGSLSYQWDFGDGSSDSNMNTTHTYPSGPATYTVTLTVTDAQGLTGTATAQVTVQ